METKFKYILKSLKGSVIVIYLTLEDLENGVLEKYINTEHFEILDKRIYTGVKDKNDREIYHKDRISEFGNPLVATVEYIDSAFRLFGKFILGVDIQLGALEVLPDNL